MDEGSGNGRARLVARRDALRADLDEAEEALDQAGESDEAMLASVLDEIDVGVWSIAVPSQRSLYVNPALARLVGRSRDTFPQEGATIVPWLHPEDQDAARAVREVAFKTGVGEMVARLVRPDGEIRWVRMRGRAVRRSGEQVDRVVLLVIDVTEQHHGEEALRSRERRFRRILESGWDFVSLFDAERRLIDTLGSDRLVAGRTAEELGGGGFAHPEDFARIEEARRACLASPGVPVRREIRLLHQDDGSVVWVEVQMVNLLGDPDVRAVVVRWRDITERKTMEERLADARVEAAVATERERARIAVDLHDHLGQALALAQIQLAMLSKTVPAEARAAVAECARTVASALGDTRTLTFELSPPLLRDLGLAAAIDGLAEQLTARFGLAVTVAGEAPPELDTDVAALLFRAVRELLANVVRHAQATRAEVVIAREGESALCVEVIDRGEGFDTEAVTAQRGGIGLPSVRERMESLGGSLTLTSERGIGTRARLSVPLPVKRSP